MFAGILATLLELRFHRIKTSPNVNTYVCKKDKYLSFNERRTELCGAHQSDSWRKFKV